MAETISGSITTGVVLAGTMVISSAQDGVITVGNQVEGQIVGGPQGEQGPQGDPGANGQGVPTGGTAGQILTKDSGTDYDTSWQDPTDAVDSVNSKTGTVVLDADDIDDTSTTHKFATASQLSNADSAVQPGDLATVATSGDYDDLTNKPIIPTALNDLSGDSDDIAEGSTNLYMTSLERSKLSGIEAGAEVNTVDSVAGKTGAVTLGSADLTATGGTSTSFLRKDNTWATPTNTTYSEISEAEITTGTASTLRAISGRRAGFLKNADNHVSGTTNKVFTATEQNKLSGIEANADVTDATNVAAAGAYMKATDDATDVAFDGSGIGISSTDVQGAITEIVTGLPPVLADKISYDETTTANMDFVIDEDSMSSNLATKVPTQQSVKAYVDNKPGIPKTFNLGTHPFFSTVSNTTTETSLNIFTLPANTIKDQFLVSFNLTGAITNTSGSTVTYTYRVKFGSLVWSVFSFDIPTGSTNVPFKANIEAICIDFSGLRLAGGGTINVSSGVAGTNDAIIRTVPTAVDPIPLTTDVPITITAQMSLANANASINTYSSTVSVVNPAPAA